MTITIVENPNGTYTSTPDCQERLCRELYRNSRCKDGEFKDSSASASGNRRVGNIRVSGECTAANSQNTAKAEPIRQALCGLPSGSLRQWCKRLTPDVGFLKKVGQSKGGSSSTFRVL